MPQAKQRTENALGPKTPETGRFGKGPPVTLAARTPRRAGISGKKKGLESTQALVFGGGGGNRTRVRRRSAPGATCLSRCLISSGGNTARKAHHRTSLLDLACNRKAPAQAIP